MPVEIARNPTAVLGQPALSGTREPFSLEDAASIEQVSKKAGFIRETLADLPTLNTIFKTTIGSARFTESIHIPKRRRFRRRRRCRCHGRRINFSNSVHSPECGGFIR